MRSILLLLLGVNVAVATSIDLLMPPSVYTASGGTVYYATAGYAFTTKTNALAVTRLGLLRTGAFSGLGSYVATLGLWQNDGQLLATTSITTSSIVEGDFWWVSLDQVVTLTPNTTYRVGAQSDRLAYNNNPMPESWVSDQVTLNGAVSGTAQSTFSFPQRGPDGNPLVGPNVTFNVVPEPSTYALLLLTGAGWLLWMRRKATL